MTIADSIRAVRAAFPEAIVEWPSELCSVSEVPGGAEVSRRCLHPKAAWLDAARRIGKRRDTSKR